MSDDEKITEENLAYLAARERLLLREDEKCALLDDLNGIVAMLKEMRAVEGDGDDDLIPHPHLAKGSQSPLREDVVQTADEATRRRLLKNTDAESGDYFLAPKAIDDV